MGLGKGGGMGQIDLTFLIHCLGRKVLDTNISISFNITVHDLSQFMCKMIHHVPRTTISQFTHGIKEEKKIH